ncbi:hypothetical protein ACQEU8_00385 [Streptomyces sp. CA-250714]|uniref:hypothetical protein n=1 Tax=Streptomyces sp. CA-250714 TaxID=3240060 RepID=UPI003D93CDC2
MYMSIQRTVPAAMAAIVMAAALPAASAVADDAKCYADWEFTSERVAPTGALQAALVNYHATNDGLRSSKTPRDNFSAHQKYSKVGNFKCSDAAKATHFLVDWNNPRRDFTWELRKIQVDIRLHNGNDTVRTVTYTNPKPNSFFRWNGFLYFPFDGTK